MSVIEKKEKRQRKAVHSAMYAPKVAPKVKLIHSTNSRLRSILVETLDALKMPNAIPSKVIYEALEKASRN